MYDSLFWKIWTQDLIEIITGIVRTKAFYRGVKLSESYHRVKGRKDMTISVTLVQSSINVRNHLHPEMFGTADSPQISLWIREKGKEDLLPLKGNGTRVCFACSQISQ